MINLDKFIESFSIGWHNVGINKNTFLPTSCDELKCANCALYNGTDICQENFESWLQEEYVPATDWAKVKVDTPIYVRDDSSEKWLPRYFAEYRDGYVYAFDAGTTSFTTTGAKVCWMCAKIADKENLND